VRGGTAGVRDAVLRLIRASGAGSALGALEMRLRAEGGAIGG
jgi:hypothetical protein